MEKSRTKISFTAFFLIWAERQRWEVPDIHIRACNWLEHRGDLAVFRCFRGFAKSTILAVYNAWRFYDDPTYRILHQGDQDKTAFKTSRDTKSILLRHPLTKDWAKDVRGDISFWWCPDADDERNPSMQASGITSNITSSRCDEAQNDDVEVPKNIQSPENREKMRARLGEQIHIMVPGARQLFVGTPHTHDSIYDEQERAGADCLTIRMYEKEFRVEKATKARYQIPFTPDVVFSGIGEGARVLELGIDYRIIDGNILFESPPGVLVDLYAGSAWPERFTAKEMIKRRTKIRTINEWDSQYQLHSKPISEVRLNPVNMTPYDVEPRIEMHNRKACMFLGNIRIAGMTCVWDPSSGKLNSDVSSIAVILQDDTGRRYWHRASALTGEVAEFAADGKKIIGGQVWQLCHLVEELNIPRITVKTNGIGQFAPAVLKAALKQRRLFCGVGTEDETTNKNERILEAFEGPLSSNKLWAHMSVCEGPAWDQMRDWNPSIKNQPDDYLDSAASAITESPERIKTHLSGIPDALKSNDWRPDTGVHEVTLDFS